MASTISHYFVSSNFDPPELVCDANGPLNLDCQLWQLLCIAYYTAVGVFIKVQCSRDLLS